MGKQLDEDGREPLFKWGTDIRYAQNLRVASSAARSGSLFFLIREPKGPVGVALVCHVPSWRRELFRGM